MTPDEFVKRWKDNPLTERAGAQGHFDDLCDLLGVDKPRVPGEYQFEYGAKKASGGNGWADVWKRGHFGWENKKPGRNLKDALKQLTDYALKLENPPLLVVCDREQIEIHTAFTGYPDQPITILIEQIGDPKNIQTLRWVFTDPEKLRPVKSITAITEEAAGKFGQLAISMRERGLDAQITAHFLIQCLFCMFAEDEGLLPRHIFTNLLEKCSQDTVRATNRLVALFTAMQNGGDYGDDVISWFNGGLFEKIEVPDLITLDLVTLLDASRMDWRNIDPAIFGTLFERGLDPKKRSQQGSHFTDPETIMKLIDPVIIQPLAEEWNGLRQKIAKIMEKSKKLGDKSYKEANSIFQTYLERLKNFHVLDPACGSGNFLYLALKALKDIEHQSNVDAHDLGLQRQITISCSPGNVLGIEIDPYAAELARVTIWIGEIQWMLKNGYSIADKPILKPLRTIENRDALLNHDGSEAEWPEADVIVGNPPFLGGSKKRGELGDKYFELLAKTFPQEKVPAGSDLVCYWFAKANEQIQNNQAIRVGLVSTNSIRGGANRVVLDNINATGKIYNAWSDEDWINEGAAVRVSLVCFKKEQTNNDEIHLDGRKVKRIFSDLTASDSDGEGCDITVAKKLSENLDTCFMGSSKKGSFDIPGDMARELLKLPNPNNQPNSNVVRPLFNAMDIVRGSGDRWIIDFGTNMSELDASLFEAPFQYVVEHVKPERVKNNRDTYRKFWWRHAEARPGMRLALSKLDRYIATPAVAKHRIFVWLDKSILPDQAVLATARADDTTFGILHSRFHELWSLRMCTWMGKGNDPRYTPTTCFETFPFPIGMTPTDTKDSAPESDAARAIAEIAIKLNDLRNNWLYPSDWVNWIRTKEEEVSGFPLRAVAKSGKEAELKKRTLTNLYNLNPAWLVSVHEQLDKAVAAAYGWNDYKPDIPDEEILKRLLVLNLQR